MKKIRIENINNEIISKFEKEFVDNLRIKIKEYEEKFNSLGMYLEISMTWENHIKNIVSNSRIPIINGYTSYIIIDVKKNNKKLLLNDDENGGLFVISSVVVIEKLLFQKTYVTFFEDINDIIEDLKQCYNQVKKYGVLEWEENDF